MQANPVRFLLGAASLAVATLAVQATESLAAASSQVPAATTAVHLAVGQVVEFDAQHRLLTVAHQDILSLGMPAMTMDFPVHPGVNGSGVGAGKTVALTLGLMGGKLTVTALQIVGQVDAGPGAAAGASAMPDSSMMSGTGMQMMAACHGMMHGR